MSGHLTREEKDLWKDQVVQSRRADFSELKDWVKAQGISFEEKSNGINLKRFFVSDTLEVYFEGTRKGYQYNLEGVKQKITKELI